MKKIHRLSPIIVSQIAAGEVIERPAYAVKELLENAIDAGADYITIQIEESGLKKITITDNGEGMNKEDLLECFKPHTTSKLSDELGLHAIKTLGFRGEALSSIAAISSMSIKSRTADDAIGTLIEITAGEMTTMTPVGSPVGTSISIQNLFHTVPARKKFLKSQRTEFRHILDVITQSGINFPHIRFFLSHNHKVIFDLPKKQDVLERVQLLLGPSYLPHLLPIHFSEAYITISGFLVSPQIASQTQQKQFIFVNGRRITDKIISLAVKEAYGTLIEATQYPIAILFLSLPHEVVDVNVHPRKEQVNFIDSRMLFETVKKAASETLQVHNISFHHLSWKEDHRGKIKGNTSSFAGKLLKEIVLRDVSNINHKANTLQAHALYLVTESKTGILIIDQHAAHERIMYEKFLMEFLSQKKKRSHITLSNPKLIDLSLHQAEILHEYATLLEKLGIKTEYFRGTTFFIHTVPELFKDRDILTLLQEILDDLEIGKGERSVDIQSKKMLAFLACRAAVKAGDLLTKKQIKVLLRDLEQTPNNTTCPHGRPTQIEISLAEMHRKFKRT